MVGWTKATGKGKEVAGWTRTLRKKERGSRRGESRVGTRGAFREFQGGQERREDGKDWWEGGV